MEFEVEWKFAYGWLDAIRRLHLPESGLTKENDPQALWGYFRWNASCLFFIVILAISLSASFVVALNFASPQRQGVMIIGLGVGLMIWLTFSVWQYCRSNPVGDHKNRSN